MLLTIADYGISVEKSFVLIPEDIVKDAADAMLVEDPANSFQLCWNAGQVYKSANMSPVYILDQDKMMLGVYAKETFMKKLH